jgi:hypothetical protein
MCWRRFSGFTLQSNLGWGLTGDVQCPLDGLLCWQIDMDLVKRWSIKRAEVAYSALLCLRVRMLL